MSSAENVVASLYKDQYKNLHLCATDFEDMKQWTECDIHYEFSNEVQCLFKEDDDELDESVHVYEHEDKGLFASTVKVNKAFRKMFDMRYIGCAMYYPRNGCKFCGINHSIDKDYCEKAKREFKTITIVRPAKNRTSSVVVSDDKKKQKR
jgi:hypothetical protein